MNNTIETYRGGRSSGGRGGGYGSSGGYGRSGGFSYGGGRSSSRASSTSGSYRGMGGDYRGSARVSSIGSSIKSSSNNGTSYTPKISGASFRPSFGVNSDNYYSGKNKPIENPYKQTSTSNTMGVYGGSQWFGWGPTVLYPIIDEPPEIIALMNDNNIPKSEVMSISEYDEKIKKSYRH